MANYTIELYKLINTFGFNVFDFELSDEDMRAIDSININSRLRFDPDNLDFHSVG